ncbi:MAG: hypothetical protein AAGA99_17035 [Actinomycetota bacterium]
MRDLLLPRTDTGALVQLLVVLAVAAPALWWARRDRDLLWFVAGVTMAALAWFALRLVH